MWRSGADRSLERIVVGARVSEVEVDLLLLLEVESRFVGQRIEASQRAPALSGGGATQPQELGAALEEWMEAEVAPSVQGRAQFNARVARNALGMLARAATLGPRNAALRAARLAALGRDEVAFADGAFDLDEPGVLAHLRLDALERLEIDQPKYAGLAVARTRWLTTP